MRNRENRKNTVLSGRRKAKVVPGSLAYKGISQKMMPLLIMLLLCFACARQEDIQEKEVYFKVKINLSFPDLSSRALQTEDTDWAYEDDAVLRLPDRYTGAGAPVRLVYCAHGAGGGVSDSSWYLNRSGLIDTLLANGYACFDVNGGKNLENMGGSRVVQSAYKAYEHIRENYNIYDEIFVVGLSMGGLSSTNFVHRHGAIVLAHGMFSPVLSLKEQAWDHPWSASTRKSIAEAYHFDDRTGNTWEGDQVTGWDPLYTNTFQSNEDTFKIYQVPVKIWHGSGDQTTAVGCSRKFCRFITNAGGYCELRELDSDNHGLSMGSPFMNNELVLFFKRFGN